LKRSSLRKVITLFILLHATFSVAALPSYEELQAAYIQKFINYIEWPPIDDPYFIIAVFGNPKEFESLRKIFDDKKISNRQAVVVHLPKLDLTNRYDIIHIKDIDTKTEKELQKLENKPVLIISQDLKTISKEVTINFFLEEEGKLRFDINNQKALKSKIKINSRLLNLARKLK